MPKSRVRTSQLDPLPEEFGTLEDFWAFWDTHSSADYSEDLMEAVDMQVDIRSSKVYCAVAKGLVAQLRVQARQQGISLETLINLWLREKVVEAVQGK